MKSNCLLLTMASVLVLSTCVASAQNGSPKMGIQPVAMSIALGTGSPTPSFSISLDASSSSDGNIHLLKWQVPEPFTQTVTPATPYQNSNFFELVTPGATVAKGSVVVTYTVSVDGQKDPLIAKETVPVDIASNVFGDGQSHWAQQGRILCEFIPNMVNRLPTIQIQCTD